MSKRIGALVLIFVCTTAAWYMLGATVVLRTDEQSSKLKDNVGELWGGVQRQPTPQVLSATLDGDPDSLKTVAIDSSDITASIHLDHRKKGLLWYSTYDISFDGRYGVRNHDKEARLMTFEYKFPSDQGIYDSFVVTVDGVFQDEVIHDTSGATIQLTLQPGETKTVGVAYLSRGMDEWWYKFGDDVSQVRNFQLTLTTDFNDFNFPDKTMSPTTKNKTATGWELTWQYRRLVSGRQIGLKLPQRINPGPFVERLTFFAPVSLFLFFFLMFMIQTLKKIDIHPMNYFFLACSFFAFHLLLAYLVDHIEIHLAMAISAAVSMLLVISYMRLVVGPRFAFMETGLSQFVYLILFSYAFFLEGYTGLTITVVCILTLFIVMQVTGRIKWETVWTTDRRSPRPLPPPTPPSAPGPLPPPPPPAN